MTMRESTLQMQSIAIFLLFFAVNNLNGQRVAPGVAPQQYQQVPVQQQHHPQQQQYQQQQQQPQQQQQYQQQPIHMAPGVAPQQYQQPGQYQQAPVQQQQQYQQPQQQNIPQGQPQQQQQMQQPQQHHGHGQPQQVLNANVDHERAHIQEHMQVPIDTSQMSEAELQFHYFKMHDSDNNNKLDGCELIKSLIHWHEQGSKEPHTDQAPHVEEKVFSDEELIALIDPILQMDDTSRDGFIDYPEFIKAQQKAAASQQQQQQQQLQKP